MSHKPGGLSTALVNKHGLLLKMLFCCCLLADRSFALVAASLANRGSQPERPLKLGSSLQAPKFPIRNTSASQRKVRAGRREWG